MAITQKISNNMALSDQLRAVVEENKAQNMEYQNYVNTNNAIANNESIQDPNKNMINLENILIIEQKLRQITESINTMVDIKELCEDWWEITNQETMLMNLSSIFKELKFKEILKQVNHCECVTISIIYAINLHLKTPPTIILTLIKSLMLYAHQNFLILIKLILSRLPQDSRENVWAYSLQALIENKGFKKKKKFELFHVLNYDIEQQVKILMKICKGRLTAQQLSNENNISYDDLMKTDQFSINLFISPLAQTFLITVEEIIEK